MKKTRITTIVGTRPEIIRLSEIIKKLDLYFDHRLIHTGQNPDPNLKDIFFSDLDLRQPDKYFGSTSSSLGTFLGDLFISIEQELSENRPQAIVILGDTNSALCSIIAKRNGIPVYHLEAGNRSFDLNVPEEINRRIVDHTADFNLVYSELARGNLLAEGIHPRKIALIGSPMNEVLECNILKIRESAILSKLNLTSKNYFLVSLHRQENVDSIERLKSILASLELASEEYNLPVIISTHPRTRTKINQLDFKLTDNLQFHPPFGFLDYNQLQLNAKIVISDSGSISEEAAILGFPAITLRDSMERPEALEAGSIIMSGTNPNQLLEALRIADTHGFGASVPIEYAIPDTSSRVVNYLLSTVHQYNFWNGIRKLN
jgi:UDP-N-acetylglucosamine 2-epimerase (non-hydrolysing)